MCFFKQPQHALDFEHNMGGRNLHPQSLVASGTCSAIGKSVSKVNCVFLFNFSSCYIFCVVDSGISLFAVLSKLLMPKQEGVAKPPKSNILL